eukprot:839704-Pelagomonas_calceolata.AAC.3
MSLNQKRISNCVPTISRADAGQVGSILNAIKKMNWEPAIFFAFSRKRRSVHGLHWKNAVAPLQKACPSVLSVSSHAVTSPLSGSMFFLPRFHHAMMKKGCNDKKRSWVASVFAMLQECELYAGSLKTFDFNPNPDDKASVNEVCTNAEPCYSTRPCICLCLSRRSLTTRCSACRKKTVRCPPSRRSSPCYSGLIYETMKCVQGSDSSHCSIACLVKMRAAGIKIKSPDGVLQVTFSVPSSGLCRLNLVDGGLKFDERHF